MIALEPILLAAAHPSWHAILRRALSTVNADYLKTTQHLSGVLPHPEQWFAAFSLPLEKTKFVLFGESPYPREASANGYAFWDAAVGDLWSPQGLSKAVNRATSLRNWIKLLLVVEGALSSLDTSQPAIAQISKERYVKTGPDLFENFLKKGFLLLNATPVLSSQGVQKDAKAWQPFLKSILLSLSEQTNKPRLILLGRIAHMIGASVEAAEFSQLRAMHPYNLDFIHDAEVQAFFKPLHLLLK